MRRVIFRRRFFVIEGMLTNWRESPSLALELPASMTVLYSRRISPIPCLSPREWRISACNLSCAGRNHREDARMGFDCVGGSRRGVHFLRFRPDRFFPEQQSGGERSQRGAGERGLCRLPLRDLALL